MSAGSWLNQLRHVLGTYPTTAHDWAARVQSESVTRQELLVLDAWLKADPRNADAYARAAKVAHLGLMLREQPAERNRLHAYARLQGQKTSLNGRIERQPVRRKAIAVAAAIVVAASGLAVWLGRDLHTPTGRYVADHGDQRRIALPDGSLLVINTDSEADVRFSPQERLIVMARGEAFFAVARDASRPFIVRTRSAEVRALGTQFSVNQQSSTLEVVVTEGQVSVQESSPTAVADHSISPVVLKPGNRLRLAVARAPEVTDVNPARAVAWTSGTVEFEDAPLNEVLASINRYTHKSFVISDPALEQIRLTGRFRIGDMESVKFALRERFDLTVSEDTHEIRLSGRP